LEDVHGPFGIHRDGYLGQQRGRRRPAEVCGFDRLDPRPVRTRLTNYRSCFRRFAGLLRFIAAAASETSDGGCEIGAEEQHSVGNLVGHDVPPIGIAPDIAG
jgi:hypothetical protein